MTEAGLRVLIVDDEPLAVERLCAMVEPLPGFVVAGCESRPGRVVERCSRLRPEVVLLDVEMPGLNGIELARELSDLEHAPDIIFVTAHEEYAVDAFGVAALDYLVKPVREARLVSALDRVKEGRESHRDQPRLAVRVGDRLLRIAIDEVRAFTAEDKCTLVHALSGQAVVDEPLKSLERQFGDRFIRVHRNALISRRHARSLFTDAGNIERVGLVGIELAPEISRRNRAAIKQLLRG